MSLLEVHRIEVTSAVDGHTAEADQATCGECGGAEFGVFQLVGQKHFHLQCIACGESYCDGTCAEPPGRVAI